MLPTRFRWLAASLVALGLGAACSPELSRSRQGPGQPLSPVALAGLRAREGSRVQASAVRLSAQRSSLGLDERHSFILRRAHTDTFGQVHVRFDQVFSGVRVWGAQVVTHTDAQEQPLPLTEDLRRGVNVDVHPALSAEDAAKKATVALAPKGNLVRPPTTELVIYPQMKLVNHDPAHGDRANAVSFTRQAVGYQLAYHVHTELENGTSETRHMDYLISARTGEILKSWSSLMTSAATGTGASEYNGTVSLSTQQNGPTVFELRDLARGDTGNVTGDMAHAKGGSGTPFIDADNAWGDGTNYAGASTTDGNGQTAAVDAAYGLQQTWDYYLKVHGRNGIDGLGKATSQRMHYGTAFDNAFWSDACFCMTYGDGSFPAPGGFKVLTSIDIIGHELSHGVTAQTAALIYSGESGGLNEANSDIHGTMVEYYARGGSGATIGNSNLANFKIGELISDTPLRYMYKPSLDGASPDEWYAGIGSVDVHFSSGPMNRAFYFLAQGATVAGETSTPRLPSGMAGVGNDKAARIWFRALTTYLTPASDYVSARTSALRSAKDLFGESGAEFAAVQNAFAGINVGFTAGTFDDLTPPTLTVLATASSGTATLTAAATDNVGVTSVDFSVDGLAVGTAVHAPFMIVLDTTALSNGAHSVTAVAFDAAGNSGAASAPFTVANASNQILLNPGFEQRPDNTAGWVGTNDIANDGAHSHSGQGYAWLGGYGQTHVDSVYQQVHIPAQALSTVLSLWMKIETAEASTVAAFDIITVKVRDSAGADVATLGTYSNLDASDGYLQRQYDLLPYKGQTVQVYVELSEDNSAVTSCFVDDFRLKVETGADVMPPSVIPKVTGTTGMLGFSAEVSDDGWVNTVVFKVDGVAVQTVTTAPFAMAYDSSVLSNGTHTLSVEATDDANLKGTGTVSFFVDKSQAEQVVNGDFEAATAGAWTFVASTTGASCNQVPGTSAPHGGAHVAILGGCSVANTSTLSQAIKVGPAGTNSALLSFWFRVLGAKFQDGAAHDTLAVKVKDVSGTTTLQTLETFSNLSDTNGAYFSHVYDLSALSGQNVQLVFEQTQVSTGGNPHLTRFRVDDVSLLASTTADTFAPTVTAHVTGSYGMIQFSADAADNVLVTKVELSVDGVIRATLNGPVTASGTFTAPLDSTTLPNGSHSLVAKAYDPAGNVGTSAPVAFDILNILSADTTAPTVTAKATGGYGAVKLEATAADNVVVGSVDFYVDDAFVGTRSVAPFSVTGHRFGLGAHQLVAKAYDASGNMAVSAPVTFQVTPDFNGDSVVDGEDMAQLAKAYGASSSDATFNPSADLDGNGAIDDGDVTLFLPTFGH